MPTTIWIVIKAPKSRHTYESGMVLRDYGKYQIYWRKPAALARADKWRSMGIDCEVHEATLDWNKIG